MTLDKLPQPVGNRIDLEHPVALTWLYDYEWDGKGATINYVGPPTEAAITVASCDRPYLKNFDIMNRTPGVKHGILVTNVRQQSPHLNCSAGRFENIRIMNGVPVQYGFTIDSTAGGGTDANNENHTFCYCNCRSATESAFAITGGSSQAYQIEYNRCTALGYDAVTKYAFKFDSGGSVRVINSGSGRVDTDFRFANFGRPSVVETYMSELANRFCVTPVSTAQCNLDMRQISWDGNVNGVTCEFNGPGPYRLVNWQMVGLNNRTPTIAFRHDPSLRVAGRNIEGVTMVHVGDGPVNMRPVTCQQGVNTPIFHSLIHLQVKNNGQRVWNNFVPVVVR